jgi:hypothetical protein
MGITIRLTESELINLIGDAVKEFSNTPKKVLGREFKVNTDTKPYTLSIKNNTGEFIDLQMFYLGSEVNVVNIIPNLEETEEKTKKLLGYNFLFKNGNERLIETPTIKTIIEFVDNKMEMTHSISGLKIIKI